MGYKKATRLIGILVFFYLLTLIDFKEMSRICGERLALNNLLFSFILIPIVILIKSLRWYLILNVKSIKMAYLNTYLIYFSSLFYGIITPGGLGEFVRVLHLKNNKLFKTSMVLSTVIMDRVYDLYIISIISIFSINYFFIKYSFYLSISISLLLSIVLPIMFFYSKIFHLIKNKLFLYGFNNKQSLFFKTINELNKFFIPKNIYFFSKCLILTIIGQIISFFQIYYICKILQLDLSMLFIASLMSLSALISIIPITIAGIGSRDTLIIYMFSKQNISIEYALIFSSIYLFIFYFGTAFFSFFSLLVRPLRVR
tara:strand:+ start:164 stop:1102 length:939 start_codon:yes stop_codon:yes gene_type:complete